MLTEPMERLRDARGEFRLVEFYRPFHGLVDREGREVSAGKGDRLWVVVADAEKVLARGAGAQVGEQSADARIRQIGSKRWL